MLLSHSGKQHSYHVARALYDLGSLQRFYTSSYINSSTLQRIIRNRNNQYWSRRFVEGLPAHLVEANWRFEVKEILYSKLFGQSEKTLNAVYQRDVKFDRYLASRMTRLKGEIFWGFQGSCLEGLKAAKKNNKFAICELAAAHAPAAVRILGEEQRLHPEWADSFDHLVFPPDYYKRLCEEPRAADIVIGASAFTLQTLREEGIDEKKLKVLPLGFEIDKIPFSDRRRESGKPLRLLFAGRITQRKGIKYILEALKQFSSEEVELHLIGNIHGSGNGLRKYEKLYHLHPAVSQYELFAHYHDYDAFVMPSVFEGFGLVIVEAMAAGLPVITTPNTIGPEVIKDDLNGYIVPIRSELAVAEAISKLLAKSPEDLSKMRVAARLGVRKFSWDYYRERLREFFEHDLRRLF